MSTSGLGINMSRRKSCQSETGSNSSLRFQLDLAKNLKSVGLTDTPSEADELVSCLAGGLSRTDSSISDQTFERDEEGVDSASSASSTPDSEIFFSHMRASKENASPALSLISFPTLSDSSDDLQIVVHPTFANYLDTMRGQGYGTETDRTWQLNPVLGHACELELEKRKEDAAAKFRITRAWRKEPPQSRVFMTLWSRETHQLELVLVKPSRYGPVLLASVAPVPSLSNEAILCRIRLLVESLKEQLQSDTELSGCVGPLPLVQAFQRVWAPSSTSRSGQMPFSCERAQGEQFKMHRMRLAHISNNNIPASLPLTKGFVCKLADSTDDRKAILSMYRDFKLTAFDGRDHNPLSPVVSPDPNALTESFAFEEACAREVDKAMQNGCLFLYKIFSSTCAGLKFYPGFLMTSSETPTSIALTVVWTDANYRNRAVAESLIRFATIHYLQDCGKREVITLVPDEAESAMRVFSRVGFRVLDKPKWENTPVINETLPQAYGLNPTANSEITSPTWERYGLWCNDVQGSAAWHLSYS